MDRGCMGGEVFLKGRGTGEAAWREVVRKGDGDGVDLLGNAARDAATRGVTGGLFVGEGSRLAVLFPGVDC